MKRVLPRNLQLPHSIRKSKKSFRRDKRNKTTMKNEEDIFHMNIRSTINVSTPKAKKHIELVSPLASKKEIKVFIPRVAFLDKSNSKRDKQ